jgi:hypothetical protein
VYVCKVLLIGAQGGWPAGVPLLADLRGAAQAVAALRAVMLPGWRQLVKSAVSIVWPHLLGVLAACDGTATPCGSTLRPTCLRGSVATGACLRLPEEVWLAVCMAAVHGMAAGRRCLVRLLQPTKMRVALLWMPVRLPAGMQALATFDVALVSFAVVPQHSAQPVPVGHLLVGGSANGRLYMTACLLVGGVGAGGIG